MADYTPEKLTGVNGNFVRNYRSILDSDNIATYTDQKTGQSVKLVNGQFEDPFTGDKLIVDSYGNFVKR